MANQISTHLLKRKKPSFRHCDMDKKKTNFINQKFQNRSQQLH